MTGGVGQGMPWWLPDDYLNAAETIALGDVALNLDPLGRCPVCVAKGEAASPKFWDEVLDPAHIVTKGMGGRPNGAGPFVGICRPCHDLEHFSADGIQRTMAIRKTDGAVCWLERHPGVDNMLLTTWVLGHKHPWDWEDE